MPNVCSGRTSRQVRSERIAGAGDSQHDGRRPVVPAFGRDRKYGQRGTVITSMLVSDYLDGSFLIGETSLRNSSTASISTDLTTCATRRRSRIPQSTIWPPRASPPLHCFSQQLWVIFPHSKGMMPAQPCTLWGDNLFQRFGFMIHICSTGPLANTAIVVLPDQTMVSIWSSLISDYKTFGTT